MPAPKGNKYTRISFNIEEGLLEKLLICMKHEHVHSQSEALRLAVREWIINTLERIEKEDLMSEVNKLKEDNKFYKEMYLTEQKTNGAIKKKFQKEVKKSIEKENGSLEEDFFK